MRRRRRRHHGLARRGLAVVEIICGCLGEGLLGLGQLLPQPLVGPLGVEQLPGEAVDVHVVSRPAVNLLLESLVEGRLENLGGVSWNTSSKIISSHISLTLLTVAESKPASSSSVWIMIFSLTSKDVSENLFRKLSAAT